VPEVDPLERVRATCLGLPEVVEEQAWVGTRWTIRRKNFAHVVQIVAGHPPAYAAAAGTDDATVLTFRCPPDDLDALTHAGPPFFKPVWFTDIVGLVLDGSTDWDEVAELVTESYCLLAPQQLAEQVAPPAAG
jgi:predicted DNA-binding protein (MmcQ/YjbR family)